MRTIRQILVGLMAVLVVAVLGVAAHHVSSHVSATAGSAMGTLAALGVFLAANAAAAHFTGGFSNVLGLTALDICKLNAADDMTLLIEKNKNVTPEFTLLPAFDIAGTGFETCIRTGYPSGAFTTLGGGVTPGGSTFDKVKIQCYPYKNPIQVRDDLAKTHRKGLDYALSLQASGAVKGGIELICKALYYGARSFGGGAMAFPGLIDLYDATNKFVDAGGTTAGTGSSAWFVKVGDMEDGNLSMVFGNNRGFSLREWILQQMVVGPTTEVADVHTNQISCAVGAQLADLDAVVRIGKLTEDAGKGMTDSLAYRALEKFPTNMKPDFVLMTKRSVRQLRDSRTNDKGGDSQAPWPTDVAGIRIVETDSILNTEALSL